MPHDSRFDVVLVYPDLLGTYGDRGNAAALRHRAVSRGIDCRVVEVAAHDPLPTGGQIYLLGGGEDAAMLLAQERLDRDRGLIDAVAGGALCLAVCAGFQLLSRTFRGPDGEPHEGLGLLDVECGRLRGRRAVGEVLSDSAVPGTGRLTGFENHQGDARLGPEAAPLARLRRGVGNGDGRTEGAIQGRIIGTYLHGPVLVRNDALADHLLQQVTGPLTPLDDPGVRRLRREREAAALATPRHRRRRARA